MMHHVRAWLILGASCSVWASAYLGCAPSEQAVRPGIEVLLSDSLHLVTGRRLGILTNQTGIDRQGRSDVELLLGAGLNLTTIFSPEHGYYGTLDRERIGEQVDSATGLPVLSLYEAGRAPAPEMFSEIDVLLIDFQDIGARTYTYISAALQATSVAAGSDKRVLMLDRPNPIGGVLVQGPLLDPELTSYVGMLTVPLRHGMTIGELALYGNEQLEIGADLGVIPVEGWNRAEWFDETGLPWVPPSPNMPDLESATHYPGLVLFEGTNLSVGRGTEVAFQVVGAPWLDPTVLLRELSVGSDGAQGVVLKDTTVTPRNPGDGKYEGRTIPALRLRVVDRDIYNPTHLAIRLLSAVARTYGDSLEIRENYFDRRLGSSRLREALIAGGDPDSLAAGWQEDLEAFRRARDLFLLYP